MNIMIGFGILIFLIFFTSLVGGLWWLAQTESRQEKMEESLPEKNQKQV